MILEFNGLKIEKCDGVYPPSDDTFLLMENATCSGRSIEIGCGTGIVSIYFLKKGCDIQAVDINELAVECARKNARRNGLNLNAYRSDLFSSVIGYFDTVLFNAPYLPVEEEDISWSGGEDMGIVKRFLTQARYHLTDKGQIYIVLTDLTDNDRIFSEHGYAYMIVKEMKFDFESILLYRLTPVRI